MSPMMQILIHQRIDELHRAATRERVVGEMRGSRGQRAKTRARRDSQRRVAVAR